MRISNNRPLIDTDYSRLSPLGHFTFRKRPKMTLRDFQKSFKRGETTLQSFGYQVLNPDEKEAGTESSILCSKCNNCIITGLADGKTFTPFSHWCFLACAKVDGDGSCSKGRGAWGPVIQVLNGRAD